MVCKFDNFLIRASHTIYLTVDSSSMFAEQVNAIHQLRLFTTQHNVHVILVIHPRKGIPGEQLVVESVGGTSKSTQEADNIIFLQPAMKASRKAKSRKGGPAPDEDESREDQFRKLEVMKNRDSGDLGAVCYQYSRASARIGEVWFEEDMEAIQEFYEDPAQRPRPATESDLIRPMDSKLVKLEQEWVKQRMNSPPALAPVTAVVEDLSIQAKEL